MELHAFHRKMTMAQAHDYARSVCFMCLRADLQLFRQTLFRHNERVIAGCRHRLRRVLEQRFAIMLDLAGFTVHKLFGPYNISAERRPNRLVSQTNTQNRLLAGKMLDQINADPGHLRRTWAGRDKNMAGLHGLHVQWSDLIVAPDLNLLAELSQILDQVVSKGIVVVENEHHTMPCNQFSR